MCDWEIKAAINTRDLIVEPFDPSLINPASLDFRLGSSFTITEPTGKVKVNLHGKTISVIDPKNKESFKDTTIETDEYVLLPGKSILGCTLELIGLSDTIAAKVYGKSSIGRLGIDNSSVATWIDPGFGFKEPSFITLEIFNQSQHNIRLTVGMKIGQLVFFKTNKVGKSYTETGRYNGQQAAEGSKGI
jgi:dCTP deaminase